MSHFMSDEYRAATALFWRWLKQQWFRRARSARAGEYIALGFEKPCGARFDSRGAIMDGQTLHACAKTLCTLELSLPNAAGLSAHSTMCLSRRQNIRRCSLTDITVALVVSLKSDPKILVKSTNLPQHCAAIT